MKNLLTTTILLMFWAGLFSQQLYKQQMFQENIRSRPDNNEEYFAGKNAGTMFKNPSSFHDYLADWIDRAHVPGMSLCILRNGETYWKSHLGLAIIEENIPVSDSTCYFIASISKTVTQTSIMQLYEQGHFELDDNINDHLPFTVVHPDYPDSIITFYQLMTHTSAINDNYGIIEAVHSWGSDSPIPLGEFLEDYLVPGGIYYEEENWNSFSPNQEFDYSNIGAALLGYITEYISGQDFDDYSREHVLNPLGINNASYLLANMDTTYLAKPYQYWNGSYIPWQHVGDPFYPCGTLKISALDFAKFLGMYMKGGTYHNTTILDQETIDLITTPTSIATTFNNELMCLNWFYNEVDDFTNHAGGVYPYATTIMGYDKDDQWGYVFYVNTYPPDNPYFEIYDNLRYFAKNYEPFEISSLDVNDNDGDNVIEANEEFSLNLNIRSNINTTDASNNIIATISVNSPYIDLVGDSVVSIGSLAYQEEFQLPTDQFIFLANENLVPGNIEFQLEYSWGNGHQYISTFELFGGHAQVLLISDEESPYSTQEWYLEVLDSLGYLTRYYDLGQMSDPTFEFIKNFPAVIWFTGDDSLNILSANNQEVLADYLNNGGQLFLSGQNISDNLAGTDFLKDYLHAEHIEDTWTGNNNIQGLDFDLIGDGLSFNVNTSSSLGGTGLNNQYSMSIIEPLEDAFKVFCYSAGDQGAAVRYKNDTFKTVFFAFGFEAIAYLSDRHEIMRRIMNDFFELNVLSAENPAPISSDLNLNIFPNPVITNSIISYSVPVSSIVNLTIYDLNGKPIKILANTWKRKGEYEVSLKDMELIVGVYFCVLKTNSGIQTKKIIKLN